MCNGRHGIACLLLAHSFSPVHKKIDQEENKRNKQQLIKSNNSVIEVSKIKI